MRKALLSLLFIISLTASAQNDTGKTGVQTDTVQTNAGVGQDNSATPKIDIRPADDANISNILALTKEIEKRKAKQKREAYIRIGIGILFLVILVIGLMRRKKK
ncbi:MAG TPA: hypothetical protein VF476_07960 [Chitinophagaceae bacterium]